ncbi:MAG: IS256 family transposase [Bacteroidales bacterium]
MKTKKLKKFDYEKFEEEAIKQLYENKELIGKGGILAPLIKRFYEAALEGESDHFHEETTTKNRRNGKSYKKVRTTSGEVEIGTPRDRNGDFDPHILKKRQRRIVPGMEEKIISMYTRGMSYRDIQSQIEEIYGVSIATGAITQVTDRVIDDMKAWQNRPLERLYTIIWMDAIHIKVVQERQVVSKAIYLVIGVNQDGMKDLLGMYIGASESAKFWQNDVLNNLKHRGVEDILFCCIDNLSGLKNAIKAAFPETKVHLCVVHQIRNSLKYVSNKERKEVMKDIRPIYKAVSVDKAREALLKLEQKWGEKHSHMVKSWVKNFDFLCFSIDYSPEIRRLIYTTNPIESFNSVIRKVTKTKRVFHSNNSVLKTIYLIYKQFTKKNWTKAPTSWTKIRAQLAIEFEGRFD